MISTELKSTRYNLIVLIADNIFNKKIFDQKNSIPYLS